MRLCHYTHCHMFQLPNCLYLVKHWEPIIARVCLWRVYPLSAAIHGSCVVHCSLQIQSVGYVWAKSNKCCLHLVAKVWCMSHQVMRPHGRCTKRMMQATLLLSHTPAPHAPFHVSQFLLHADLSLPSVSVSLPIIAC